MWSYAKATLAVGWPVLLMLPSWALLGAVGAEMVPPYYKGALLAAVPFLPLLAALLARMIDWRQTPAVIWAGTVCAAFDGVIVVVGLSEAFVGVEPTGAAIWAAMKNPATALDFPGLFAAAIIGGAGTSIAVATYRGTAARAIREGHKRSDRTAFGSSRTAKRSEILPLIQAKTGIPIGEWCDGRSPGRGELLRFPFEGNLMTIAPMGAGKGRSGVGAAMMGYDGAVCVTDPKAENAAVWAYSRRLLGRRVVVMAPLEIEAIGPQPWRYNPFDYIRPGVNFQQSVNELAEAIVVHHPDDKAHFTEITKVMVAGGIAWIYDTYPPHMRNLGAMYDFFTQPGPKFMEACAAMVEKPAIGQGLPAQLGKTWLEVGSDERGSIWTTLLRNIAFMNDPAMRIATGSSNFDIYDFARDRLDMFLCLPFTAMKTQSRWLRLMIAMAVGVVIHRRPSPDNPRALMVLDELPTLGAMTTLLDKASGTGAVTIARALGLQIWAFLQHPNQLPALYGPDAAKTWRGTNAVMQVFGTSASDNEFPEEVSKLMGEMTVEIETANAGMGANSRPWSVFRGKSANRSVTRADQKRRVMTPDEVRRLPRDKQLLFVDQIGYPIVTERAVYDQRPEWHFKHLRNPYVKGDQPHALVMPAA